MALTQRHAGRSQDQHLRAPQCSGTIRNPQIGMPSRVWHTEKAVVPGRCDIQPARTAKPVGGLMSVGKLGVYS